ncbi:hypothetical protein FRC11_006424 [Ceratobasidium sp. 423]|nr:hypothetical protein FRC11_006424 [Ceratobasidium sp. 423]
MNITWQVCKALPKHTQLPGTFQYLAAGQPTQVPLTSKPQVLQSILSTPLSGLSTPALVTPTMIHPSHILVMPASTISTVSPIQEWGFFGQVMTHGQTAFGEATNSMARSHDGEDDNARMEIGSLEEDMDHEGPGCGSGQSLRLPPIQSLPPMSTQPIYTGPMTISQDVLLYGPAGVMPAPAEPQQNNVHDQLPLVPAFAPPHQATFFSTQNIPVANGDTQFATLPSIHPIPATSSHPVYPPAGLAPLVASHQGLSHRGLTAPIEHKDEMADWKEHQHAKERADIVVNDGELTATVATRTAIVGLQTPTLVIIYELNQLFFGRWAVCPMPDTCAH